jgi:hypothetical protein
VYCNGAGVKMKGLWEKGKRVKWLEDLLLLHEDQVGEGAIKDCDAEEEDEEDSD